MPPCPANWEKAPHCPSAQPRPPTLLGCWSQPDKPPGSGPGRRGRTHLESLQEFKILLQPSLNTGCPFTLQRALAQGEIVQSPHCLWFMAVHYEGLVYEGGAVRVFLCWGRKVPGALHSGGAGSPRPPMLPPGFGIWGCLFYSPTGLAQGFYRIPV